MTNNHQNDHNHKAGRSIAARFSSGAEAREAVAALHKAHYTHTWIGTTSLAVTRDGEEAVTVESGGGFFSQTHSLVDALVSHGVLGEAARQIEDFIEPGDALVTVDPKDRDAVEVTSILAQHGGSIAGTAGQTDLDFWLAPSQPRTPIVSVADPATGYGPEDAFFQRPNRAR